MVAQGASDSAGGSRGRAATSPLAKLLFLPASPPFALLRWVSGYNDGSIELRQRVPWVGPHAGDGSMAGPGKRRLFQRFGAADVLCPAHPSPSCIDLSQRDVFNRKTGGSTATCPGFAPPRKKKIGGAGWGSLYRCYPLEGGILVAFFVLIRQLSAFLEGGYPAAGRTGAMLDRASEGSKRTGGCDRGKGTNKLGSAAAHSATSDRSGQSSVILVRLPTSPGRS